MAKKSTEKQLKRLQKRLYGRKPRIGEKPSNGMVDRPSTRPSHKYPTMDTGKKILTDKGRIEKAIQTIENKGKHAR